MSQPIIEKYNSERFKIGLQYFPPDLPDGETIDKVDVGVYPLGLMLEGDSEIDGNTVKQMIGGGKRLTNYVITFNVEISTGNSFENTILIKIVF